MSKMTLEEVAKLAGVSRATVSRVVNGYPHIRPEVRERVQRVIQQTGYHPNAVARSLASNQSHILGLFIPSVVQFILADHYLTSLIPGISQACNAHEYTLALFLFHSEEEEQQEFRRVLGSKLIDGLIITADRRDGKFMSQLLERNMPFVLIGRPAQMAERITSVDAENTAGAYMGVRHLIQLGHKRIALISTTMNTAAEDRTAGYRQALLEHGLPVKPELIALGDFTEQSGYDAMQRLLPQRPDAVVAASDMMAFGALRAVREANLAVPDDIAVVSFDDVPAAASSLPPLTTIRQPIHQTGMLAVETLIETIQTEFPAPRHIVLPTELVIRASCGAVRSTEKTTPQRQGGRY